MLATPTETPTLRLGARVLLLDRHNHVLLIHAQDPHEPDHHWWELPGGGAEPGEALPDTARRELAEETGIIVDHLRPHLWDRETRFHYRGQPHHHRETVYLARITTTTPTLPPRHTTNEKTGLLGHTGGANPNWLPAQTNCSHPTCQPCSPTRRQENSLNRCSCTTNTTLTTSRSVARMHARR
jgi:8-oxo-dGTP pyrophosphatase MutT (NUDIX family)